LFWIVMLDSLKQLRRKHISYEKTGMRFQQ
jgi:hypothetical protein